MPDRWAFISAVVLAAGLGSRFGGGKLLVPWRGGVLLDGALGAALRSPCYEVVVVTGAYPVSVEHAARRCALRLGAEQRMRFIHAPAYADGLSASLAAGLAGLLPDQAAALVFLGDMPLVPDRAATALHAALGPDRVAAVPVFDGRRGHPVLIRRALFKDISALSGDRGAGGLLAGLGGAVAEVAIDDPGILFDVDRPADLVQT